MSAIQQMLFAGRAPITVSGTVYGSGSLAIPAGVTSVSLTGQGGTGTTNYNPGQAYIAPSPGYRNYTNWTYGNPSLYEGLIAPSTIPGNATSVSVQFRHYENGTAWATTTIVQKNTTMFGPATDAVPGYSESIYDANGSLMTLRVYYDSTVYGATAGQSYIAPYYTYTTGPSTTATLNGVTNTWTGGYGGAGSPSSQPLSSTGSGQTLTYSVGSGGYLVYEYTY